MSDILNEADPNEVPGNATVEGGWSAEGVFLVLKLGYILPYFLCRCSTGVIKFQTETHYAAWRFWWWFSIRHRILAITEAESLQAVQIAQPHY